MSAGVRQINARRETTCGSSGFVYDERPLLSVEFVMRMGNVSSYHERPKVLTHVTVTF